MYHAKNPRKKKLTVRVEKCYRIVIEDETGKEVYDDLCFLPHKEAKEQAQRELQSYKMLCENGLENNVVNSSGNDAPAAGLAALLFLDYCKQNRSKEGESV